MTQKATVLEIHGKTASVLVRRSSMCEGCEKKDGCASSCLAGNLMGANQTMTALASNDAGAGVGDTVEIESGSRTVLSYAALIFLFPILVCAAFYAVGMAFSLGEGTSLLLAGIGFVVSFLLIILFDRLTAKRKKDRPDIRITRILSRGTGTNME